MPQFVPNVRPPNLQEPLDASWLGAGAVDQGRLRLQAAPVAPPPVAVQPNAAAAVLASRGGSGVGGPRSSVGAAMRGYSALPAEGTVDTAPIVLDDGSGLDASDLLIPGAIGAVATYLASRAMKKKQQGINSPEFGARVSPDEVNMPRSPNNYPPSPHDQPTKPQRAPANYPRQSADRPHSRANMPPSDARTTAGYAENRARGAQYESSKAAEVLRQRADAYQAELAAAKAVGAPPPAFPTDPAVAKVIRENARAGLNRTVGVPGAGELESGVLSTILRRVGR